MMCSTAVRSGVTGARTSSTMGWLSGQNWRLPSMMARNSARLRLLVRVPGLTRIATAVCAGRRACGRGGTAPASASSASQAEIVRMGWRDIGGSEHQCGLQEKSVDARLIGRAAGVAVFSLERRERAEIVAHADDRARQGGQRIAGGVEHRVGCGDMNVFKAVVGLPSGLKPRQAVGGLGIPSLAAPGPGRADSGVLNVGEFGDELWPLARVNDVRSLDPFSERTGNVGRWADPVAVDAAADLPFVGPGGLGIDGRQPSLVVVDVAGVARFGDIGTAPVADAGLVVQVERARARHQTLGQQADKMDRQQTPAELDHLRTADGGLQPKAVVVGGVPVGYGRVVAAGGDFEVIAVVVPDDGALERGGETVGPGRPTDLGEVADLGGERAGEVQHELAQIEIAGGAGRGEAGRGANARGGM